MQTLARWTGGHKPALEGQHRLRPAGLPLELQCSVARLSRFLLCFVFASLSQGSDPSCSCHSFGSSGPSTLWIPHLCQAGIKPASQCSRNAADLMAPHWELLSRFFFFFSFLGPCLQHVEVPRLGVKLELPLPACTTATDTPNPCRVCDLHPGSRRHQILNPLIEARDQNHVLMDTNQICFH